MAAVSLPGDTVKISGHISQSMVPDIAINTPFTASVVYNSSGTLLGAGSNFANYSVGGSSYQLSLKVGTFTFSASGYLNMLVSDGPDNSKQFSNADVLDVAASSLSNLTTNYIGRLYYGLLSEFVGDLSFFSSNVIPVSFQADRLLLGSGPNPSSIYLFLDAPGEPSSGASVVGVIDSVSATPGPFPTSTSLSVSAAPTYGAISTFRATIAPSTNSASVPGGLVTFHSGPTTLGTAPVINGIATLTKILAAGNYSPIDAAYGGDQNFLSSTSSASSPFTIQKAQTRLAAPTLISGSPIFGQALTLSATVTQPGGGPTGAVSFADNGLAIGSALLNGSGVATLSTALIGAGPRTITATYGGDANYLPSPSPASLLTVGAAAAPVNVTSTGSTFAYGQPAVFTARFTGLAQAPVGGSGVTATFVDVAAGLKNICSGASVTNGATTCSATLNLGPHSITVSALTGDIRYQLGNSTPVNISVNKAATMTSVTGPAVSQEDTAAVFTANVAVVAPGAALLTGFVSFLNNGASVAGCENVALTGGAGTCTVINPSGTYSISASYSGDSLTSASSGATQTTVILPAIVVENAASYVKGSVSADEIVVLFGHNLTDSTAIASVPLPFTLASTTVQLTDSSGASLPAQLLYVSPGQINCVLPATAAAGEATLIVKSALSIVTQAITVKAVAPGLFSGAASGQGVAAANVVSAAADGTIVATNSFAIDNASGMVVPLAIDLRAGQVYVVLYGTGIRHATALTNVTASVGGHSIPVQYAGESPGFPGLDQINLGPLPASFEGRGLVDVSVVVDGQRSNTVTLTFK